MEALHVAVNIVYCQPPELKASALSSRPTLATTLLHHVTTAPLRDDTTDPPHYCTMSLLLHYETTLPNVPVCLGGGSPRRAEYSVWSASGTQSLRTRPRLPPRSRRCSRRGARAERARCDRHVLRVHRACWNLTRQTPQHATPHSYQRDTASTRALGAGPLLQPTNGRY